MWGLRFEGVSGSVSWGLQQVIRGHSWMAEGFFSLLTALKCNPMNFSVFMELYNYHHNLILEHFHLPKRKHHAHLYSLSQPLKWINNNPASNSPTLQLRKLRIHFCRPEGWDYSRGSHSPPVPSKAAEKLGTMSRH